MEKSESIQSRHYIGAEVADTLDLWVVVILSLLNSNDMFSAMNAQHLRISLNEWSPHAMVFFTNQNEWSPHAMVFFTNQRWVFSFSATETLNSKQISQICGESYRHSGSFSQYTFLAEKRNRHFRFSEEEHIFLQITISHIFEYKLSSTPHHRDNALIFVSLFAFFHAYVYVYVYI